MLLAARNPVIVVAHPDDETLWCGGLMIRYDEVRWTVICCSIPQADPVRAWKFFDACAALGASGRLLPYTESLPGQDLRALGELDLTGFDLVVTHNVQGEYGHPHHKGLHNFIIGRAICPVMTIGYRAGGIGKRKLDLTQEEREHKLAALKCYNHHSPTDGGKPKWQALLDRYGSQFDFGVETYDHCTSTA